MHNATSTFTPVASALRAFVPQAVERLNYLYPHAHFETCPEGIQVVGDMSDDMRRDINYALHRAKIAEESRTLREMLHRSALL